MNTGTRSYLYIPVIMYLSNFILQADFKQFYIKLYNLLRIKTRDYYRDDLTTVSPVYSEDPPVQQTAA